MSTNVRSATIRKGRRDPGLTPTEQRRKNELMRQFIRGGDGPRGNSPEYLEGWDRIFRQKGKK